MKSRNWLIVLGVVALCLPATSASGVATLMDVDLGDTANFVDQSTGTGVLNSRTDIAHDPGYRFNVTLTGNGVWSDVQIGDSFDLPSNNAGIAILAGLPRTNGMPDLTGLGTYEVTIRNPNASGWFMANIFLNSGATDLGEADNFYENGWEWLAPGSQATLSIDLSTVLNVNHISNIGIKIGSNVVTGSAGDYQMSSGTPFDVDVVPAPGAALLAVIGMGVVGRIRRRKLV